MAGFSCRMTKLEVKVMSTFSRAPAALAWRAPAAQPEAIAMVGSAMKELAQDIEAAFIFSEALRADRELQRCALEFYAAERRVQRPLPRKWHDHLKALVLGQMIESILLETVAI